MRREFLLTIGRFVIDRDRYASARMTTGVLDCPTFGNVQRLTKFVVQ